MNKASDSENFGSNRNTHRCFCLWISCSGTYSPSHGVKHWALGAVFGRVSAELEGDLCLSAVWWLWGFLAGLSPLLRGSSGLSNSSCEQSVSLLYPLLQVWVLINIGITPSFALEGRHNLAWLRGSIDPFLRPPHHLHKQNCSWPPP